MQLNEVEFNKLFDAYFAHDSADDPRIPAESPEAVLLRTQKQRELLMRVVESLPPERYSEYVMVTDPNYLEQRNFARALDLPVEDAKAIYSVQQGFIADIQSPDASVKASAETRARERLATTLSGNLGQYLSNSASRWITAGQGSFAPRNETIGTFFAP